MITVWRRTKTVKIILSALLSGVVTESTCVSNHSVMGNMYTARFCVGSSAAGSTVPFTFHFSVCREKFLFSILAQA